MAELSALLPVVDPTEYNDQDLHNTLRHLSYFLHEYANGGCALAPHASAGFEAELRAVFDQLSEATLTRFPDGASLEQMNSLITQRFNAKDGAGLARPAVEQAVRDGIAIARRAGQVSRSQVIGSGTVAGLFLGSGGVPKTGVDTINVGWRGVDGDVQASRQHHGRAFQALCLWSTEVIDALRSEGHPIAPGSAGENITLSGFDWAAMRPGVTLKIGEVLAEISSFAEPCSQNARWFSDRKFTRIDQDRHPGWSRLYAWVLRPGTIRVDDTATIVTPVRDAMSDPSADA